MARRKARTGRYDSAALPKAQRDIAAYLEAAMEDGDSRVIAAALGNIARAKGMTELARDARLGRESLCKALSLDGNPEFSTILKVVHTLGLWFRAEAVSSARQVGRATTRSRWSNDLQAAGSMSVWEKSLPLKSNGTF